MTNLENPIIAQKLSENDFYVIDKSFFSCSVCNRYSLNLYEGSCCNKFLCIHCKNKYKKEAKCPNCQSNKLNFKYSFIVKKMLLNSNLDCPLCEYNDNFESLISHLKQKHQSEIYNKNLLSSNEELFELLLAYYELDPEKKYYAHNHSVVLKPKAEDQKCFLCEKRRPHPIKPKKSENQKEGFKEEKITVEGDKEELDDLGKFLVENLTFKCEICDKGFCKSCIESTKIYVKSNLHEHEMKLFFGINKVWTCASTKREGGCPSDSIESAEKIKELPRYKCKSCDFDLCEKCMILSAESV